MPVADRRSRPDRVRRPRSGCKSTQPQAVARSRDLQTVADPDTPEPPTYIQPDADRRLGEPWRLSEADLVAP